MMNRISRIGVTSAFVALFGVGWVFAQRASVPKSQDKLALGEEDVKQLLLLMDTDKNGKITKAEWMNFMSAEFDRLDRDKSGDLDANDLRLSALKVSHPVPSAGK
jgi:Ca2+-binding EF-hand superfamily protein